VAKGGYYNPFTPTAADSFPGGVYPFHSRFNKEDNHVAKKGETVMKSDGRRCEKGQGSVGFCTFRSFAGVRLV